MFSVLRAVITLYLFYEWSIFVSNVLLCQPVHTTQFAEATFPQNNKTIF